ncbi:MAG: metallophosphoesterase [Myxococcota bacterium]
MPQTWLRLLLFFTLLLLGGCCAATTDPEPAPSPSPSTSSQQRTVHQQVPNRLVAIGDIHGDLKAAVKALRIARAIDAQGRWVGGDLVVVQTGDLLDRGDDEQAILDLLKALQPQAHDAGGALIVLHGNHEIMNVMGDLRYVTPGGFEDFKDAQGIDANDPALANIPEHARARMAAFAPGGPYARTIADHKVIAVVGDTVFVHGGVLPDHVRYGIDTLNAETSAWMRRERSSLPALMRSSSSPVWSRHYSSEPVDASDCALLHTTLNMLGAARMVVGHTVQRQGITSACEGKVWRIDTGMSAHYGGQPQVLEISSKGDVRILTADIVNPP